jgi:transketolase
MRERFVKSLIKLAERDKDIWLLTGDLGFNFIEPFAKKFPDRFINCGVIEQSMVGIACGLADMGKKPYVYSASTFLIFRAFEQIRNDVCYGNRNVKLVGFAGKNYNFLGHSHLPKNKEDVKMLRFQPNIKIYEKCEVVRAYKSKSPAYLRLI